MPRKSSGGRNAAGTGSIRKKIVKRDGKEYAYWEARYTDGFDPGTGKQIQRSITGKTQKEVAQRLKAITASIDTGTYIPPNKMTVGEWLDIWADEYLGNVKPFTVASYRGQINNHIKPTLGAIKLDAINTHTIQGFYNTLSKPCGDAAGLSAKTVKNIHGVLHKALQQAVVVGYLRFNPADACILPRVIKKELTPLDEVQSRAFLNAIRGHRFEMLFTLTLFTGMLEGEVLGLQWNCVDFANGTILIDKQLQREKRPGGNYVLTSLKNDKPRRITPAPWLMERLDQHRAAQEKQKQEIGGAWEDSGFVFTNELGRHLAVHTVYKDFKAVAASIGRPTLRFHDLRHSFAVAAIRSGDDIKTVQGNLGHATAAFTLDVYGHVTDQMKQASAQRMEAYIKRVLDP